jgi:hypothetical protein
MAADIIKDFMGIFPNAFSKEYCDRIITRFDYCQKIQDNGKGKKRRVTFHQFLKKMIHIFLVVV